MSNRIVWFKKNLRYKDNEILIDEDKKSILIYIIEPELWKQKDMSLRQWQFTLDSLKDLKKCKYITVHANGGLEMLRAIKKKAKSTNKDLKILAVTILTSLNNKSLKEIGHTKSVKQLVLKQADLIKKSGCDGIVCSAQEAKIVRKKYKNLFIVTPGIRLPGDSPNDQLRIMTPNNAFRNKVSGIVMGRSLIKGNIKNNIQRLVDHLNK